MSASSTATDRPALVDASPVARATRSPRLRISKGNAGCLLERGPQRSEHTTERRVGEQAEHHEGEQRTQIPAAGAREVATGAAAREDHAEAEHQATQDVA